MSDNTYEIRPFVATLVGVSIKVGRLALGLVGTLCKMGPQAMDEAATLLETKEGDIVAATTAKIMRQKLKEYNDERAAALKDAHDELIDLATNGELAKRAAAETGREKAGPGSF